MSWYRLSIDAAEAAAGKVGQVKDAFAELFKAAGGPRAMALFQKARQDGGVDLFFTPDAAAPAAELIDREGAVACPGPPLQGLHLLVGHNEITYYLTT